MAEKRKSRRIVAPETIPVKDSSSNVTVGYLRDLSIHGMMVTGKGPFEKDQPYQLKVVLPRPVMGTRTIELRATCKWKTKTANRGVFDVGLQFPALPQDVELLIVLIQAEYAVRALPSEVNC
jgi:hypothetical protein